MLLETGISSMLISSPNNHLKLLIHLKFKLWISCAIPYLNSLRTRIDVVSSMSFNLHISYVQAC